MRGLLTKYLSKLFIQQWIIGFCRADISEIIRKKRFDPEIKWIPLKAVKNLYADPFICKSGEDYQVLFEDYSYDDAFGKISVMNLDGNFQPGRQKVLLNTEKHLSYPFIFSENGKVYVFPEASQSGRLSCYEYDPEDKKLYFLKDVLDMPLLDSTILRHDNRYWLFATINGPKADSELHLFYSENLLGPYLAHDKNPVQSGLDGSRPAGNIIEVDGGLYRPAQNSRFTYGESITVHKIDMLSESAYKESFYMTIRLNKARKFNKKMHGIHTINTADNVMVVDGTTWRFSPAIKLKQLLLKFSAGKTNKAEPVPAI